MSKIAPEFQYVPDGSAACDLVRAAFSSLLVEISAVLPQGRPRSIALTHLQDACMWAVRGVAESPRLADDPDEGGQRK